MSTPYTPQVLTSPEQSPENAEFWAAASEGRLLVRHCERCEKPHWYPRTLCPFCMGETYWKAASGRGTIYSYSVTRRAGPTQFCMAYVTLEEGVTMMTRIVDCDLDTVRIGQKVQVTFTPTDNGPPMPTFKPL
ncbi:DNA-binding protein [Burkholderiaceae bacterium 16]|nr:DNA-binding protein [Burkholderiaceae bacterium 16]